MDINQAKKIHIVGDQGIGISALAKILAARGARVSGSDVQTGGHRAENVPTDAELLIYSNAVPADNAERVRAGELGIPELSYPQALGEMVRGKKVIAVAGTNGKTTTTAMIGWVLEQAEFDPTVIVGSRVLAWDSNARAGKSEWVVIEADEYKRAFLNYDPDIAVITNIALDHLDYFENLTDIKKAFLQFTQKIKPGGVLVFNMDDGNASSVAGEFQGELIGFSANEDKFDLQAPGSFNQANAAAAVAVCRVLGISQEAIIKALREFSGTWRRFEKIGKLGKTEIISDYAHHPDAIRSALQAAAETYPGKKVLVVFQPHQHNRTKKLFSAFVEALRDSAAADMIIPEIFDVAGREAGPDQDISSKDLVKELKMCGKQVSYAGDLQDCEEQIRKMADNYDAIILMGAGDIYKVAENLTK